MNPLNKLSKNDFCIQFPATKSLHILALKMKCEQLGILWQPQDTREKLIFSTAKKAVVNEVNLKEWINNLGVSQVFDKDEQEEYNNWLSLISSDASSNKILGVSFLNTLFRPEPKFFTLWVVFSRKHSDKKIKEISKKLVLQYWTKKEWEAFDFSSTIRAYIHDKKIISKYISIDYLTYWLFKLITDYGYGYGNGNNNLYITTDNLEIFLDIEKLVKNPEEIDTLSVRIEEKANLDLLSTVLRQFKNLTKLSLFSNKEINLPHQLFHHPNLIFLNLNNILPFSLKFNSPSFDKVKFIECSFPQEIEFSDHHFPNVECLTFYGKKIKTLELTKSIEKIRIACFYLPEQNTLPKIIYRCTNLKHLGIHNMLNFQLDKKILQLKNLTSLNFSGTPMKDFPTMVLQLPKLTQIDNLQYKSDEHLINVKDINSLTTFSCKNHYNREFPYNLSHIKTLRTISFCNKNLSSIDHRIQQFKNLITLNLSNNKFNSLPETLLNSKIFKDNETNLRLDFSHNQIKTIPFEWIIFINQTNISLNLSLNHIKRLPSIPQDFDRTKIKRNQGKLNLFYNKIATEDIKEYRAVFGERFISI